MNYYKTLRCILIEAIKILQKTSKWKELKLSYDGKKLYIDKKYFGKLESGDLYILDEELCNDLCCELGHLKYKTLDFNVYLDAFPKECNNDLNNQQS